MDVRGGKAGDAHTVALVDGVRARVVELMRVDLGPDERQQAVRVSASQRKAATWCSTKWCIPYSEIGPVGP